MKKKLTSLLCAALMISGVASAQTTAPAYKFGHINTQELLAQLPERDSAEVKYTAFTKDLQEQVETLQVEFNKKQQTFDQKQATWTDAIKEAKYKELEDMYKRIQEFNQTASQEAQRKQSELMRPIVEKATKAIEKVAKANGFTYIFDITTANLAYYDKETSIDVLDLVLKELNITKKTIQAPAAASAVAPVATPAAKPAAKAAKAAPVKK